MKKPFYKCWWFWLIIGFALLLCVGNVLLAHFIKDDGANIFTAVSGWVSGIATAILGVIAVVQTNKYNFISAKNEFIDKILNERNEIIKETINFVKIEPFIRVLQNIDTQKVTSSPITENKEFMIGIYFLRDLFTIYCNQILEYNYIPNNLPLIHNECAEMITKICSPFCFQTKYANIDVFYEDYRASLDLVNNWVKAMHQHKRNILKEIAELLDQVKKCDTLDKLEKLNVSITAKAKEVNKKIREGT